MRLHHRRDPAALQLLASNTFDADSSEFNASPAFVGDRLLIRSDAFLYCLRQGQ